MTNDIESVRAHYRAENIAERLLTAAAGAGVADITPEALAPVDEFHTGGLAATRQLAVTAGLTATASSILAAALVDLLGCWPRSMAAG